MVVIVLFKEGRPLLPTFVLCKCVLQTFLQTKGAWSAFFLCCVTALPHCRAQLLYNQTRVLNFFYQDLVCQKMKYILQDSFFFFFFPAFRISDWRWNWSHWGGEIIRNPKTFCAWKQHWEKPLALPGPAGYGRGDRCWAHLSRCRLQ